MKSINKIPVRNIVIIGENRQEFCIPQNKDIDQRNFFSKRNQLYSCFPYEVSQCIWTFHGHYIGSNEVIVYPEGGIHRHSENYWRGQKTSADRMKQKIDEEKNSSPYKKKPKKLIGMLNKNNVEMVYKFLPFIIVGVVLAYAFLSNGM